MLKNYMGILTLNEIEDNVKSLTKSRPLSSVPIGGRYRIIDFILSNMSNSGIKSIGIYTNKKSRSLIDHLGSGKPWDLDRKIGGLFLFNFTSSQSLLGDINLISENMEYIRRANSEYVIISSSNMVCNIDYSDAANYHEQSNSDITIIYKSVNNGKKYFIDCNTLYMNGNNTILSVGKNVGTEDKLNISMEMFIMKKSLLIDIVNECTRTGYYTTLKSAIYNSINKLSVNGYEFKGYVQCINSIKSYYKANIDMLNPKVTKELFFNNGLIYTKVKDEAPTKYFNHAKVSNSLISNGCIVKGDIENSIISRRVIIDENVEIKNCIIFQNCQIKKGCKLTNAIIDKNTVLKENTELKGDSEFPIVIEKKLRV